MNQESRGIPLGTALAIGGTIMVLGIGSCTPQSNASTEDGMRSSTANEDGTQSRTPIDVASLGPQVGEQVPAFSLPDQNGQVRTLESILGRNGAMILFHRSADW